MDEVVKKFNTLRPKSISAEEKYYKKGDNELIDIISWVEGEQIIEMNGKISAINISKIEPQRSKTFKEAMGQVSKDYKSYLTSAWLQNLRKEFEVRVDMEEIERLFSER
jgi:peptidyl-prolyl cis-trans isomerase SurA